MTLVALLAGVSSVAAKTVYIQPNDWTNDGAVISLNVYVDGSGGNTWVTLTEVETGILKATFDDSFDKMIIVRGSAADDWDAKYNQSANLGIVDGKLYSINSGSWDGADVDSGITLSDYTEPVAAGYIVDFNTQITTSDHAFQVASNWRHIVGTYEDYWGDTSYPSYSYSADAGVDGSGALSCITNQSSNSLYDLLVTPVVKGTVTIDAKTTATYYTPQLTFYKITDNGDGTYTRGEQITVDVSAVNASSYTTITIPVDAAGERIGIRSSYVWLDNFTATEATIIPEPKMVIASAVPTATTGTIYWDQQANGKVLVSYTVTVTNTGDVALTQGDENYSVSIINGSTNEVYATVPVPQNLAIGETSAEFVVSAELETSVWPNSYTYISMNLKENLFGTVVTRAQSRYTAYEPKFVFREAGSTATSSISAAEAWGTIMTATTKSFEIANTGTAPLTIKSVTLPDGFTSDNAPAGAEVILAKGETLALNITQDATAMGTFAGNLSIVYLDKDNAEQTYTLAFSATVIGANTWTADFNNSTSTVVYPEGSVAEGGINRDYNYISSGNYNNWLIGRTGGSYSTENNKFITPKLHANAGDQLAFDVKAGYSGSNDYFVKVYVSTDRNTWGEPVAYYTYTTDATKGSEGIGSAFTTKTVTFDTAGDYYVAFALYGTSGIDNLVGLEKVDVAHDLYIKSVSWPDASIKSGSTQSKPSVTFIPLTTETAENYTVKYLSGTTVLGEGTSKALTASATSSTDIAVNWTPNVTETTVYPETKVVIEFTDGTKFETETFDLTVTNEAIFHFLNSVPSSKWYEPTDRTAPITFGKTNTADTQSFVVYNWGSASLTVNSISLPEGFTTTTEFPFTVAAFDESDLAVASKALDITFSATAAGTYSGDMVITYSGDQTFTLPISGTKLDLTKWYANFNDEAWPAGSVYQDNVSIAYIATGDYGLMSSSSTKNLFITPKLTAVAGDVLQFDASTRNNYYDGTVKVFIGTDRENFGDAVKEIALSKTDNVSKATYEYTFATAGDYYVAFALDEARVDEIYGLKLAEVAHDLKIASSNIPTEGMQNYNSTATVNVQNFGVATDKVTVTAYINGVAVATSAETEVAMNHKLSDAGTEVSVSYMSNEADTFPVYLEVKAGETTIATDPVNVTFAPEEAKSEADMATNGTTFEVPLYLNYKNSESVTMYNAEALANAGLTAGSKIKKITYKGYKTTDEQTTSFQVYYKWTDDQTLAQPATTYPYAAADNGMTKLIDEDHTWAKVGSSSELGEMIVLDFSSDPLTYEEGKSLVIYMHSYVDGYKSAYFEKSTLSSDFCYTRRADATSMSSTFNKAVPAAIHFTLDASVATLAGKVQTSAGQEIVDAEVVLKASNGVQYSGVTDTEGNYSINVIQAGLDFTATVEADGFLKREFALNMGGASATQNVTLFKQIGLVGTFPGFPAFDSEGSDLVMTQSADDPNIFTYEVKNVALDGTTYEYKLRADGKWATALADGYELPSSGNNNWEFGTKMYPAGTYNLTFTADMTNHTLTLVPVLQLTLENSMAAALDYENAPADVTIGRTLKAGWNAIVLPFELDADEITAAFGTEAEVAEFDGDVVNGENVSITFTKSDVIEANVPYLLYLDAVPAAENLKFEGKTVTFAEAKVEGNAFNFVGIYQDGSVAAGDFIVADGKFYQANGGNGINAYRSYLQKKGTGARTINFYIDDEMVGEFSDTTTGINGIAAEKNADGLYNLSGQKVNNSSRKGVYIQNGKKVVVGRR